MVTLLVFADSAGGCGTGAGGGSGVIRLPSQVPVASQPDATSLRFRPDAALGILPPKVTAQSSGRVDGTRASFPVPPELIGLVGHFVEGATARAIGAMAVVEIEGHNNPHSTRITQNCSNLERACLQSVDSKLAERERDSEA